MSQTQQTTTPPTPTSNPQTEIRAEEIKALFSGGIGTGHFHFHGNGVEAKPLKSLIEDLPRFPGHLHLFRDPRHDQMRAELEKKRFLLLTSYQESAAYAAAHALMTDDHFDGREKKAVLPLRGNDRERSDLHLLNLADQLLDQPPQIILVEIKGKGALLDSVLTIADGEAGLLCDRLENSRSYVLFVADEDLFEQQNAANPRIPFFGISHIRYLLERDLAARADDLERRLVLAMQRDGRALEPREFYRLVADRLALGADAFDAFLAEIERTNASVLDDVRVRRVTTEAIIREDSEIHRAATFVATYFPDLGQRDFDVLVLTLLGDQTVTVERTRTVIARDGSASTVREEVQERWADRWQTAADRSFRESHLGVVISADGSLVVDFKEPYLRRELRAHFERNFAWYVRQQFQTLQDRGVLFSLALSQTAVETLVRLFVERAVGDPLGFGGVWLFDLVRGLRIELSGEPPTESREATLAWLLERLAVEAQLRAHFYGRLALLIREMLDREVLRPMVREFFEFLISAKQHEALLDVVLDLARRLRFAPHFDPLIWLRRLLDQGTASVRERTAARLIKLARDSGARIYEFIGVVRSWLPEAGRAPERFSVSNRVALEFPFAYCLDIASSLPKEHFGEWPSRHPLFYALPPDGGEARREIGMLVAWILDPRGVALEVADGADPTRTAEAVRLAYAGDLIEHWAWVLQGVDNDGAYEARALFRVIAEEIDRRLEAGARALLLFSWQRRRDEYMSHAVNAHGVERTLLFRRRTCIEQLLRLFMEFAAGRVSQASQGVIS